jgi:CheY-like chemotaxis protein
MRLLIVEDFAPMRRLLRSLLEGIAEDIYECSGGHEAVRVYAETRPDWVLMDLQMADGNGLEATRAIHNSDGAARIVIVTQYDGHGLREAAAEAGAVAYVLKENLLSLRRVLGPSVIQSGDGEESRPS